MRPVFMTIPVDRGSNFCSRARSPCHHWDRRARREKWDFHTFFRKNSIVESFVGKMLIFEPFQSAASFLAIKSLYSYLFLEYFDVLLFTLNCSSFLLLLSLLDSTLSRDAWVFTILTCYPWTMYLIVYLYVYLEPTVMILFIKIVHLWFLMVFYLAVYCSDHN